VGVEDVVGHGQQLDAVDGLVAESLAFATLQAGSEFRA